MRKHLLLVGLGLLCGMAVSAQSLTSPYTGSAAPAEADGEKDFYLYNVGTGTWLQSNDYFTGKFTDDATMHESWYTTRLNLGTAGLNFGIKVIYSDASEVYYRINPYYDHNANSTIDIVSTDGYLDTNNDVNYFLFEDASEETGLANSYRITLDGTDKNSCEYPYLYADTYGYFSYGSLDDEFIENSDIWQLVTREERIEKMVATASSNNPVDCTWLIGGFCFSNRDQRFNNWKVSVSQSNNDDYAFTYSGTGSGYHGINYNYVMELWNTYTGSIKQTIKNIPNGTYKLAVQGFYREGSAGHEQYGHNYDDYMAFDNWSEGNEHHYAKYFANGTTAPLASIFDDASDTYISGSWEYEAELTDDLEGQVYSGSGLYIPNTYFHTSKAFATDVTAYQNDWISATVADSTLQIGIIKEAGLSDDWVNVDNFQLQYCGSDIDADAVKKQLEEAIAEAEALTDKSTDILNEKYAAALEAAKAALASGSDVSAMSSAATTLSEIVDLIKATSANVALLRATYELCVKENVASNEVAQTKTILETSESDSEISEMLTTLRLARRLGHVETQENAFSGNAPKAGQSYYLYNVGQKRFFCGGVGWGTHAAVGFPGIPVTLNASSGSNTFIIDTRLLNNIEGLGGTDESHYLNYNGYCDTADQEAYTFIAVGNGVYNIVRSENNSKMLGYAAGTYETVNTEYTDGTDPNNQWILVTKADRDALLNNASESNPVDASHLIKMPNFSQREYEITGGWDNIDAEEYAWEHTNGSIYGRGATSSTYSDCAFECYNTDPLLITQTVTGLKPGYYILSVQGLYRDAIEDTYYQKLLSDEPVEQLAYLTATPAEGDEKEVLLTTYETGANMVPGLGRDSGTELGLFPRNPLSAVDYFQVGCYKNSTPVVYVDGTDNGDGTGTGELTITVSKEGATNEGDWVVLDNFRLTYLGKTEPTGINGVSETVTSETGKIYNLQGVQVNSAKQRGVYIKNGKKFVVK